MGHSPFQNGSPDHGVTFEICQRIRYGAAPLEISEILPGLGGIRVGDTHNQVTTPCLPGHQVLEMIVVQHLESTMDHANFWHLVYLARSRASLLSAYICVI